MAAPPLSLCSHGLLHAGHVLEVLPAVFSAAPDSHPAAAALEGGGGGDGGPQPLPPQGLPDCPFPPAAAAAVRSALADAVLAAARPEAQLGGRLPAALVAALAARWRRLDGGVRGEWEGPCGMWQAGLPGGMWGGLVAWGIGRQYPRSSSWNRNPAAASFLLLLQASCALLLSVSCALPVILSTCMQVDPTSAAASAASAASAFAQSESGVRQGVAAALDALFWRLQYAAAARGRLRDFRKVCVCACACACGGGGH